LRFYERDLRVKVTAILLLLVIVALVSAGLVSYSIAMQIVRSSIDESMLDSARLSRSLLQVALERRQSRQSLFAGYPVLRDPNASPASKSEVMRLFIETWPIGLGAILLDTGGNPVAGTGNLAGIGNVSQTTWFKNAQTGGIAFTYIDDPGELAALHSGSPLLAVSSAVRDPGKQIYAYLVSFTGMDDIYKAIDSVKIKETGHAFLMENDGHIIAGELFGAGQKPRGPEEKKLVQEMARGGEGSLTFTSRKNKELVTYTPVEPSGITHPEVDWTVGVVVPASEAYGPVRQIAWALLGLTAFFVAVSIVAAVLLGRSIARPVEELAASAERIGSGDLTGEVVIRTRDQIGTLAAAFLRMRDYLRSALGDARYSSDRMTVLAEEQSAATDDVFGDTEEIVGSAALLVKNMEAQAEKIRRLAGYVSLMPEEVRLSQAGEEVRAILEESAILAEVGSGKAVEIASATQDQRAATRDVAAAARRLSEMARELKGMVDRFKV